MDGVVSLLDPLHTQKTLAFWRDLRELCGAPEIKDHFAPHFSWHVAEGYDSEELTKVLQEISLQTKPFSVRSTGIGIFSGEKPVIYVSLLKDRLLLDFHEKLWCAINEFAVVPSPLYAPENWVPHITIYFEEIFHQLPPNWDAQASFQCALNFLVSQRIEWEIPVDNFAYGCMDHDGMQLSSYLFGSQV